MGSIKWINGRACGTSTWLNLVRDKSQREKNGVIHVRISAILWYTSFGLSDHHPCVSFPAFLHFGHSLCFGLDLLFTFSSFFLSPAYPLSFMSSAAAAIAIRIPKRHVWLSIASTNTARQPCYRQRSAYYTATALLRRTHKTHSGTSHDHHHVDLLTTMQQSGTLKHQHQHWRHSSKTIYRAKRHANHNHWSCFKCWIDCHQGCNWMVILQSISEIYIQLTAYGIDLQGNEFSSIVSRCSTFT